MARPSIIGDPRFLTLKLIVEGAATRNRTDQLAAQKLVDAIDESRASFPTIYMQPVVAGAALAKILLHDKAIALWIDDGPTYAARCVRRWHASAAGRWPIQDKNCPWLPGFM